MLLSLTGGGLVREVSVQSKLRFQVFLAFGKFLFMILKIVACQC